MKTNDALIPKALQEVWEWKEAVYEDTKNMTFEEKKAYFHKGLEEAAQLLGCRLVELPNGSYKFRR